MLRDDEYDQYCQVIAELKQQATLAPRRKRHRLPMESYAASDCDFFFTLCAHERHRAPFNNTALADAIIESLMWSKRRYNWTLHCYCLMPDHLHFIVRLPDQELEYFYAGARGVVPKGILDQVGNFKKFTTTQVWWKRGGANQLWQRSSYDRAILYRRSLEPAILYVLNNPVRRGLVEDWRDYPYAKLVDATL